VGESLHRNWPRRLSGHLPGSLAPVAGELPEVRLSARVVRIARTELDAYIKARRESR
jgi:hypothetical protein